MLKAIIHYNPSLINYDYYTLTENMDKQEKDPMAWQVLESEYLFKQPWLTARREHVKLPTGAEIKDFYVLEYP